jgi:hypothetical protein
MSPEETAAAVCADVYARTRELYAEVAPSLGAAAQGFRIMYAPISVRAPALIVGLQPGGEVAVDEHHAGVPEYNAYTDEDWRLAARLKEVWPEQLRQLSGLNVNFFRQAKDSTWRLVDPAIRRRVEEFCLEGCLRLVEALQPQKAIVIGLGAFDRLTSQEAVRPNPCLVLEGAVLARRGIVHEIPVVGVRHLTGSRMSTVKRKAIYHLLRMEVA